MKRAPIFALLLLTLSSTLPSHAAETSVHGFLQGNYSFNTDSPNPAGGDLKWAEERIQIKAEASGEAGGWGGWGGGGGGALRAFLKADFFSDHVDEDGDAEIREAYLDLTMEKWDLRAGRQIVTWGLGDLVFINDVFPKDYEAFFSGRPIEYLKKGVDAVRLGLYPGAASFEIFVIPFFEPNSTPSPERFWVFDPMPGVTDRRSVEPATNAKNTELAVRAYGDLAGFDASLYFYKGFYRLPSILPDSATSPTRIDIIYPELYVYGGSLQRSALDGVLGLEAGYYDSKDDESGEDPFIPNSQTKLLASYQRQMAEDLTAALQYYGEYMHSYSGYEAALPSGLPKESRFRQLLSLRMTYLLMHQNLRLSWFSFWSPTDRDYLLNPEVKYNFSDHVWGAIGANLFGGEKETTQFGSLDRNDNVYLQARYEF